MPEAGSCVHELTYTAYGGLVLIPLTIEGSPPLDFVLDSGATHSALTDPYLAGALGLEIEEAGIARGLGSGAKRVLITEETSLVADGVELERVALVIHDIGERLSELAGREIHGLLGAELFERYVVEIDPARRVVVFHDPALPPAIGEGLVLPLSVEDKRPVVEAVVTVEPGGREIPVRLMVDTGSSRNLTLIERSRRRLKAPKVTASSASVGVIGPTEVTVAPVAMLQLGRVLSRNVTTTWVGSYQVPALRNIPDLNGILGNGLVSQLRTIFDYRRGVMVVAPIP